MLADQHNNQIVCCNYEQALEVSVERPLSPQGQVLVVLPVAASTVSLQQAVAVAQASRVQVPTANLATASMWAVVAALVACVAAMTQ
jgi:hypothetical protein